MVKRDEMFRIKALIFMVPLVLPIGQPPAEAVPPTSGPAVQTEGIAAPADADSPALSPTLDAAPPATADHERA